MGLGHQFPPQQLAPAMRKTAEEGFLHLLPFYNVFALVADLNETSVRASRIVNIFQHFMNLSWMYNSAWTFRERAVS